MKLDELKHAISGLLHEEFVRFQSWFEKIDAVWQRKQRAKLGKLNSRVSAGI